MIQGLSPPFFLDGIGWEWIGWDGWDGIAGKLRVCARVYRLMVKEMGIFGGGG